MKRTVYLAIIIATLAILLQLTKDSLTEAYSRRRGGSYTLVVLFINSKSVDKILRLYCFFEYY